MIRPGIRRFFHLNLRRRETLAAQIEEEIRLHIALRAESLQRSGLSPADAYAEAERRFGPLDHARRDLRHAAMERERTMAFRELSDAILQDLQHAARGIRREPAFALMVALTLAVGIGANAAMFGIVDRLLVRGPAHVVDADRVQRLYVTMPRGLDDAGPVTRAGASYPTYATLGQARSLERVAAYAGPFDQTLGRGDQARPIQWQFASWTLFPLLQVRPHLGRFFAEDEDRPPKGADVAVLSHDAWRRAFNSDPQIIGKTINLGPYSYVVVGVAPEDFTGAGLEPVDVWTPITAQPAPPPGAGWQTDWDTIWMNVIARVRAGVGSDVAGREATELYRREFSGRDARSGEAEFSLRPLRYTARGTEPMEAKVSLWLVGVAAIVLLVACANVANLLLARSVRRRREVAVRIALGAGRARLARLFFAEGLLFAVAGGAAGLLLAHWGGNIVRALLLPNIAWTGAPVDTRVLLFSLGAITATALLLSITPMIRMTRPNVTLDLKEGTPHGGGVRSRLREGLTAAQAALSAALLVGAALLVVSLRNVQSLPLGIEPERVLSVALSWATLVPTAPDERARERARRDATRRAAFERLRRTPGIASVALVVGRPFQTLYSLPLRVAGFDSLPVMPGGGPFMNAVSSDYFVTVGTRIVRGTSFTPTDDQPGGRRAVIINETMARTLWPNADAVGQCIGIVRDSLPCAEVIGVAQDAHRSQLMEKPAMQLYVPLGMQVLPGGTTLLVRPADDVSEAGATAEVRRVLREIDQGLGYVAIRSLQDDLDPQLRPWRLGATMFSLFGGVVLLIAVFGVYSVMTYNATQRKHEMAVRVALGADRGSIAWLTLRRGLGTAGIGIGVGLVVAFVAADRLTPLLFGVDAREPSVFLGVAAALLASALLASAAPARRSTRVDPVAALRGD